VQEANPDCRLITTERVVVLREPAPSTNQTAWAVATFGDIVEDIMQGGKENDYVQLTMTNANAPGYVVTTPVCLQRDFKADMLLDAASNAAQSSRNFSTSGEIKIILTRVDVHEGSGARSADNRYVWEKFKCVVTPRNNNGYHRSSFQHERIKKGQFYVTRKDNNYCGIYAFYIGMKYWEYKRSATTIARKEYEAAVRQSSPDFAFAVDEIMERCGLDLETSGMANTDWETLQKNYPEYKIRVHNGISADDIIYEGSPPSTYKAVITILLDKGHYAFCTCTTSLFQYNYECPDCKTKSARKDRHVCKLNCIKCGAKSCGGEPKKNNRPLLTCRKCALPFYSEICFQNHLLVAQDSVSKKPKCETFKKCKSCNVCYSLLFKDRPPHQCGEVFCANCASIKPKGHLCYITRPKAVEVDESKYFLTFYDIETTQNCEMYAGSGKFVHEPVLICASTVCFKCKNIPNLFKCDVCGYREKIIQKFDDPTKNVARDFVNWAYMKARGLCDGARREKNRTMFLYAHNSRSFDGQFLMKALASDPEFKISFAVLSGRKIMRAESTRDSVKLVLLDFLNFVTQPLNALCKAFKIPFDSKGSFPVFFINPANYHYKKCELPPKKFWCPDAMTSIAREEFNEWYTSTNMMLKTTQTEWSFVKECIKYCLTDVRILQHAALAFSNGMLNTLNYEPLTRKTTIASTCLHIYRQYFMPECSIGINSQIID
jgi:hypothetical protein